MSHEAPPIHPAIAAIEFAIQDSEARAFLDAWLHGDFDVIRREWPEAPQAVFVQPDPPSGVMSLQERREAGQALPEDVRRAFEATLQREATEEDLDKAFWFGCGFQAGAERSTRSDAQADGPSQNQDAEMIEVAAVRGGEEVPLGAMRMPPRIKIREVARSYVADSEEFSQTLRQALHGYLMELEARGSHLDQDLRADASRRPSPQLSERLLVSAQGVARFYCEGDLDDEDSDAATAVAAMLDLSSWMLQQGWVLQT